MLIILLYHVLQYFHHFLTQKFGVDPIWKKTGFKPPARRWWCWKMIPLIDLASRCGGIWNNILGQRTKQPCPGRRPRRHLENDPFLYHILRLLIQMPSLIWDVCLQEPGIPCVSNCFFTCFCYESSASMTRTTGRYLNANESVDGICELCGAVTKVHGVNGSC